MGSGARPRVRRSRKVGLFEKGSEGGCEWERGRAAPAGTRRVLLRSSKHTLKFHPHTTGIGAR